MFKTACFKGKMDNFRNFVNIALINKVYYIMDDIIKQLFGLL